MEDLTLITVNWNNQPCLELMLKSYIKHHHIDARLKFMWVDNNSSDSSVRFGFENELMPPMGITGQNIGHENALNLLYPYVKTKYCLLVDTDIVFNENIYSYLDYLDDKVVAVGDLIQGDQLGEMKIKPRLGAWFIMFNIEQCRLHGITQFRNPENNNASYDVGSEFYENIINAGLKVRALPRINKNPDGDLIGMQYGKFDHLLRMSWDLTKHGDRRGEIERRQKFVLEKLKEFQDIDLKGKYA